MNTKDRSIKKILEEEINFGIKDFKTYQNFGNKVIKFEIMLSKI